MFRLRFLVTGFLVAAITGANAETKPLYCAIDDAVLVKREKTRLDLCYGDKCTRIDNLETRMTQKPGRENTYTAAWSLGDLAGSTAELHASVFGYENGVPLLSGTTFTALGREATCDGDLLLALPDDQSRPRPQLICSDGKRSGFLGNIEPILDANVYQDQLGKPFRVGLPATRNVDDTGGAVVDLGEGITILREGGMARIVSKYGTATCKVEYPPANFGGLPITRPGIEVQDARTRAMEFKEAEERQIYEIMEREKAEKQVEEKRLAAVVSCRFSDGTWFKDGIMHTLGEPDLRVRVMGDSRNKNKISFISPRMLGDADLGTGGAKMTTIGTMPEREYLGHCEKITN
jgi:hypothetical protein